MDAEGDWSCELYIIIMYYGIILGRFSDVWLFNKRLRKPGITCAGQETPETKTAFEKGHRRMSRLHQLPATTRSNNADQKKKNNNPEKCSSRAVYVRARIPSFPFLPFNLRA